MICRKPTLNYVVFYRVFSSASPNPSLTERAKLLFNKMKRVSFGVIAVAKEAKVAYDLRKKTTKTRREQELIRNNEEAVSKVIIFGVLQAVPVIGYIPIFVALSYPRQILTSHFWSEEERDQFMREEHEEKQESKKSLQRFVLDENECLVNPAKFPAFLSPNGTLSLEALPSEHMSLLAITNGIFTSSIARKYSPDWLVRRWLKKRAIDIARDDKLLQNAAGVETLEMTELRLACLQRGANPTQTDKELRIFLKQWLQTTVVKQVGKSGLASSENSGQGGATESLLLHACAIPDAFSSNLLNALSPLSGRR